MDNYDIKRVRPDLYGARRGRFDLIDVPSMPFLMADGHGDPNTSPRYAEVVEALFVASYAVRAVAKRDLGLVHTVGPLEGLWSAQDLEVFHTRAKACWDWTMMIVQPPWVTRDLVDHAIDLVAAKRGADAAHGLGAVVRWEEFGEGLSVQTLHVGSYDDEGPTIAAMHDGFLPAEGLSLRGRHHEIYLSDVRRTAPEKLRTILRQPVTA